MITFLELVFNNALISGLFVLAISGVVGWFWKARRDRRDSKIIYDFLVSSRAATEFGFRSTEAIASNTKLPEDRVAKLCAGHPKIRRNEKEKQSWRLAE